MDRLLVSAICFATCVRKKDSSFANLLAVNADVYFQMLVRNVP